MIFGMWQKGSRRMGGGAAEDQCSCSQRDDGVVWGGLCIARCVIDSSRLP